MVRRVIFAALALVSIVLCTTACSDDSSDDNSSGMQIPPTVVTVTPAKQEDWYDVIRTTGTLSAFQGIMVSPEVSGKITAIYVNSGAFVTAGTPLFQIYPDVIQAEVDKSQAAVELAQLDYDRYKALYTKRAVSKQDLDEKTSKLEQDQATLEQKQAQLAQYTITAPFNGMVGLKQVDLGSFVSPGQELVNFQQVDPLRVEFTVPESYLSKIALDQTVNIIASSYPDTPITGNVYAFDSAVNPNTRALSVRARVPNKNRKLTPGTFAEVALDAGEKHSVIIVPQPAIVYSPSGLTLYLAKDGKAVQVPVTLGTRKGNSVEITSGISVGDQVISNGQVKLRNNAPIIVAKPKSANGSSAGTPAQQNTTNNNNTTNSQGN